MRETSPVMKLLREPLIHFLMGGAVLFLAWGWIHRGDSEARPDALRVTEGEVAWISLGWSRQWMRPPTREELSGLVTTHVRERLLAREAQALGLADDDTVVRRRLAQKMLFLIEESADSAPPTDDDLQRVLQAKADFFRLPARVSFHQVPFDAADPAEARRRAETALRLLQDPASASLIASLGDASLLPRQVVRADHDSVAHEFGESFAAGLAAAEAGRWTGPIASPFGVHVVFVDERLPERLPELSEIRESVLDEWQRERRRSLEDEFVASLLDRYDLVVDEAVRDLVGDVRHAPSAGPIPSPAATEAMAAAGQ